MEQIMMTSVNLNSFIERVAIRTVQLLQQKTEQQSILPKEQFLTIQQASELLNLSVPTLYSKVSKGELPVMKRGKRLYFSQTELLNYIKEGKKKTTTEIEAEADAYLSNKKGLK